MSFKKALTKMGLVEEEVQVVPKAPAPQQPIARVETQVAYTAPSLFQPPTPTPIIDPAISEMLNKSLKDSQLAGFDYMKFVSAVEEMRSSGVPENAIYKMAFSTARQMGVGKEDLLNSGQHYLGVLKEDEDDFNASIAQYEKNEIQSRQVKLSQTEASITDLSRQLAQLQKDHTALMQEVQEQKDRLETRKSSFQMTLQNFRATIESNIQKINQYLQ